MGSNENIEVQYFVSDRGALCGGGGGGGGGKSVERGYEIPGRSKPRS